MDSDKITPANHTSSSSFNSTCSTNYNSNKRIRVKEETIYSNHKAQVPTDYLYDIWKNLQNDELDFSVGTNFMENQTDLNEKMRAILIDWLVEVHNKFRLQSETLFLAVNLIDRYLAKKSVLRSLLQLLGITALYIACKYEEVYFPELKDFVYVVDKAYSQADIVEMELSILNCLSFDVTVPSSLRFLEILAVNFDFSEAERSYGQYLIESFLIDWRSNRYNPSLIALSATYIVMKLNGYNNYSELYKLMNSSSNDSSEKLEECAKNLYYFMKNFTSLNFRSVVKKYSKTNIFKAC